MDQAKNFAKGVMVTTGVDETTTSISVDTGQGARFPTAPFNAVIWNSTDYPDPADDPNVEVVRVTAKSTDTFTITRGQEGSAATPHDAAGKTYQIIAPLTAKVINDDLYPLNHIAADVNALTIKSGTNAAAQFDSDAGVVRMGDHAGAGNSTYVEILDGDQQVVIHRQLIMPHLPSTNPNIAGALYYDSGTGNVKRSAG